MFQRFLLMNMKVFIMWALAFTAGYCFGGITGVGVVAVLLLLIMLI